MTTNSFLTKDAELISLSFILQHRAMHTAGLSWLAWQAELLHWLRVQIHVDWARNPILQAMQQNHRLRDVQHSKYSLCGSLSADGFKCA
jgi:hypothetical protein